MKKIKKSLAEGIRNQNLFLFKQTFSDQEQKLLSLLSIELVADAWALSSLSGIWIVSCRRALTGLKKAGEIKEVGSVISETSGAKCTQYSLFRTTPEQIREFKNRKEKERIDAEELINKCKNMLIDKEELKNMTV
ncbi:MAG: hypothetical protein PHN88_02795 [Ignavibacteria bacterium]|nr:hypothetical protein [Ignavibacteria bacterium]